MNKKHYGICMTECDIVDEVNSVNRLQIADLVQIVYTQDSGLKCSIKIMDSVPMKFSKTIYSCDSDHVIKVSNDLMPFLITADFDGRLDILRFKKRIVNLKIKSKIMLQLIYTGIKHFVEFEVQFIGEIPSLGEGYYVGLNLTRDELKRYEKLIGILYKKYNKRNATTASFLTFRVEELFTEIELGDTDYHSYSYDQSNSKQYLEFTKKLSIIDNKINDIRINHQTLCDVPQIISQNTEDQNKSVEPMEVDSTNEQNYNKFRSSMVTDNKYNHNAKILKELDSERSNKNTTKMCVACYELKDLFTFPCGHPFCYKCLLERLDQVKLSPTAQCLNCNLKLQIEEAKKLHQFLDENLGKEENSKTVTKNENDYTTHQENSPYSKQGAKSCEDCFGLENLFTFPCGQAFCYKCLVQHPNIKKKPIVCPKCKVNLKKQDMTKLNSFIEDNRVDQLSKRKENEDKKWYSFGKDKKKESSEKEKKSSSSNKTETRFCKHCHTTNKYSALSCNSCHRPLSKDNYSYI